VGHREGDFDFRPHLSQIFPYVTCILICLWIGDPEAPLLIHAQVVQKLEEHIKVGEGFYPNNALGGNIDANFPRLFPGLFGKNTPSYPAMSAL
jgi:hypothetical protein